ncbi:DUF423 domain-containing protein [Colwellia sp. KU-HH00111]|uniref:DUF423 domain-containing protein n=1 Tax=Colwellia sp. KU-HH00111 TaxID=3127652 RepID=UPI00310A0385
MTPIAPVKHPLVKSLMIFVGVSGCFSVLFGAWLAHAGQTLATEVLATLETALQYQLFHTLALMATLVWAIASFATGSPSRILLAAGIAFMVGIVCFSGSIYIKIFYGVALIGKLTPFGGISLAVAWLLLSIEGKNNL